VSRLAWVEPDGAALRVHPQEFVCPILVATGVWSLAHRGSFERVTGPKEDYWLVQTLGALAIAIGVALGVADRRRVHEPETMILGLASCIAFGLASVRASQTESRIYLGDALLEIAFLAAWLEPLLKKRRPRS
jgi:hypothetical protein